MVYGNDITITVISRKNAKLNLFESSTSLDSNSRVLKSYDKLEAC